MKFLCIFGHKLYVKKAFTYSTRCVGCRRCNNFWAMSDEVKAFLPWDGEFAEMYNFSPYSYDKELFKSNP